MRFVTRNKLTQGRWCSYHSIVKILGIRELESLGYRVVLTP